MPAKAPTQAPANPKTGPLLERLIRERRPVLERIAARKVRPDQIEDAIQAACLGFLRAFDPATATGGDEGAFQYLATSVDNSAMKIIRGENRRRRGLPPARFLDEEDDPVRRAADVAADPAVRAEIADELASRLEQLRKLPIDQCRVMVARAAGFGPEEIQRSLGLAPRQYRKRIEKARRRIHAT